MTHVPKQRTRRHVPEVPVPDLASITPGNPLAPTVSHAMQSGFGHSFENVRVHDGAEGDQIARDLDARAVTVGEDLFFRDGAFAPGTAFGSHVLAHELAHV